MRNNHKDAKGPQRETSQNDLKETQNNYRGKKTHGDKKLQIHAKLPQRDDKQLQQDAKQP